MYVGGEEMATVGENNSSLKFDCIGEEGYGSG